MLTAHSGCEGTAMNSVSYIRAGIRACPDALEVDIRMSDGLLVLDHGKELRYLPQEEKEPEGSRQECCYGWATGEVVPDRSFSRADETNEGITLEECLRMLRDTKLCLNADLKEPHLEGAVLTLAEKESFDSGRIVFTGCLGEAASLAARIGFARVYANPEEIDAEFYHRLSALPTEEKRTYLEQLLRTIRGFGMRVINVNYRICDKALLEACRRNDLRLSLWTVDDPKEAEHFLEPELRERIENITTNRPRCLRKLGW